MSKVLFKNTHALIKRWAVPEIFGKGHVAKTIKEQSKFAHKVVKTPLPCLNPLFAFYYRTRYEKTPILECTRTFIDLYDGGVVGIDKVQHEDESCNVSDPNKPIILMFPGGNESTYATKIQTLCSSYLKAGYGDVFMCNYRGRCNTPFKTPRFTIPYGKYNELGAIVAHINGTYKDRQILLTGDCFGGFCIVDFLTRDKLDPIPSNVIGGVCHSVQWNLEKSNEKLLAEPNYSLYMKPWAKYTKNLLIEGRKGNEKFTQQVLEKLGEEKIATLSALSMEEPNHVEQLYRIAINPLSEGAFQDEADYMNKTSPHKKIENSSLARPLVLINGADDPTAPISSKDIEAMEKDPNMCLWLFACGGHCSYVKHMYPVTNFIDEVMVECSDIVVKNFG